MKIVLSRGYISNHFSVILTVFIFLLTIILSCTSQKTPIGDASEPTVIVKTIYRIDTIYITDTVQNDSVKLNAPNRGIINNASNYGNQVVNNEKKLTPHDISTIFNVIESDIQKFNLQPKTIKFETCQGCNKNFLGQLNIEATKRGYFIVGYMEGYLYPNGIPKGIFVSDTTDGYLTLTVGYIE